MNLTKNDREVFTVKETDEWLIEVCPMIFNWRVVLTPRDCPETWEHGWCYFGTGELTFLRAVAAAQAFDPATESAPMGYDKALTSRT